MQPRKKMNHNLENCCFHVTFLLSNTLLFQWTPYFASFDHFAPWWAWSGLYAVDNLCSFFHFSEISYFLSLFTCTCGFNIKYDLFILQETLLNLLLRNYLHYNLYDQAEKLRSKAPSFGAHSNQQVSTMACNASCVLLFSVL